LQADIAIDGGVNQPSDGGEDSSEPKAWKGQISRAKLVTEQGPWQLDKHVNIAYQFVQQQLQVAAHCWRQQQAKVCLTEGLNAGKTGTVKLKVYRFNLNQLAMFLPSKTALVGVIDAEGSVRWQPDHPPEVDLSVLIPKGLLRQALKQPVEFGWNKIALNAQLKDDRLASDWLVDLVDNGQVSGKANISDLLSEQRTLDARLILEQLNLNMLQSLIGEYGKVAANINSDLHLTGSLQRPQVSGQLTVDELMVIGDITPVELQSGELTVNFSGYQAALDAKLRSQDGDLRLDGQADWRDLAAWQASLNLLADELRVSVPPIAEVKVTPDLTITATPERAVITGDIYLPWGRIKVKELPQNAVGLSADEVILDEHLQPVAQDSELSMAIESDVNIHIGDDFRLDAFGLTGGLIGQLNVTRRDKGPFIVGEINIDKGEYRSFGQDLIINEGQILMSGPPSEPYLAISAIRNPDNTQDDVVAGIRVTGPASEPVITIFSEPAMAQQNALSYLLRGQDLDSEGSGNSVTTALIGVSLAKSGRIVGEIGEAFGVSDLQLDTAGSGDESQVTVSGYLLPGLQVKYGVGIFDSFGEFTLRYRLMSDLYLEAVSGVDSAVDVLYQFEFE
jgi:translocation and assembly module TamB